MSYPILYSPTETDFEHNGLGILGNCASCEVTEEANGIFELAMRYPMDGIHFEDIVERSIIKAKSDPFREPQLFRVYAISRPMSGIVTVLAEHISYDLSGIPVSPFLALNAPQALNGLKLHAVTECPFEFWTDKETSATFTVAVPASIRSRLGGVVGSILDVYGGEYEFDNYTVKLHNNRGMNRGVSIRYGKNLTDVQQDQNCSNVATGIYPYWSGDVDGTTVLVELPEKIVPAPGTYDFVKIRVLDMSGDFDVKPSIEELRKATENYIDRNEIGVPSVSLTVSFAQLEQSEEYKGLKILERVGLFDTVNVEFPALRVSATAKAVKLVYDVILDRVKSVTLGKVKTNIADTIVEQSKDIEESKKPSFLQQAVENATKWITGGKGYIVAIRDEDGKWKEICSLDEPDIETAVNVWRWNNGGFGFSRNGYNGPYELALTQDGRIVADFITTGTLNAAQVNVINLVADSITSGTLDADKISVINLNADNIVAGVLSSVDGSASFDLNNSVFSVSSVLETGDIEIGTKTELRGGGLYMSKGLSSAANILLQKDTFSIDAIGHMSIGSGERIHVVSPEIFWNDKKLVWSDNGNGTYTLMGRKVTT